MASRTRSVPQTWTYCPPGRIEADHFLAEALRAEHQLGRDDAFLENALVVIDVVQKQVHRLDALQQAVFDRGPFVGGKHARDQVEGKDLLDAAAVGVDGEGDALVDEDQVGAARRRWNSSARSLPETLDQRPAMRVRLPRRLEQFVPGRGMAVIAGEKRQALRHCRWHKALAHFAFAEHLQHDRTSSDAVDCKELKPAIAVPWLWAGLLTLPAWASTNIARADGVKEKAFADGVRFAVWTGQRTRCCPAPSTLVANKTGTIACVYSTTPFWGAKAVYRASTAGQFNSRSKTAAFAESRRKGVPGSCNPRSSKNGGL